MEFISTRASPEELVLDIGSVKVEQLARFFRDAKDADNVLFYVRQFINSHIFDYNQARNEVSAHNTMPEKEATIRRRILAFWVASYCGFSTARSTTLTTLPSSSRAKIRNCATRFCPAVLTAIASSTTTTKSHTISRKKRCKS